MTAVQCKVWILSALQKQHGSCTFYIFEESKKRLFLPNCLKIWSVKNVSSGHKAQRRPNPLFSTTSDSVKLQISKAMQQFGSASFWKTLSGIIKLTKCYPRYTALLYPKYFIYTANKMEKYSSLVCRNVLKYCAFLKRYSCVFN